MTQGKHLTIALAIALPLLAVGGGLALASSDTSVTGAGLANTPNFVQVAEVSPSDITTTSPQACGGCLGYGNSCIGTCTGNPGEDCTGACPNGENGVCPNGAGGTCTGGCTNVTDDDATICPGTCSGSAGYQGGRCGRGVATFEGDAPWCSSCDVVGLNQYPTNSPRYTV